MNIHPLIVHLPIGILLLYVFVEVFRISFFTRHSAYTDIKTFLVVTGSIAAYIAFATGDMAEELAQAGKNSVVGSEALPLIETHAMYAAATVTVFTLLAGSYLFKYLRKRNIWRKITGIGLLQKISRLIQKTSPLLALLGAVLLTITGALGASLVYGPDIDIFVSFIYNALL